jgi:hypothetical protein
VPDAIFAERRLAELYDPLDPDRSDLDVYAAMAGESGVRSLLDIGCGTGEEWAAALRTVREALRPA